MPISNKLTITIGIPAYNEERNIYKLVRVVLSQVFDKHVTLKKIIVYSDGSSDKTIREASKIHDRRLLVIDEKINRGKPLIMNNIFKLSTSDVCVILDADITLTDNHSIADLVKPMLNDKNIQLVSGRTDPLPPVNLVQKIIHVGFEIWEKAILIGGSDMYRCGGPIRAFRYTLYKNIQFPPFSADDVFPYLYCKTHNLITTYSNKVNGWYKLPKTFSDYLKQLKRFSMSEKIQTINFGNEIVYANYTIDFKVKLKALASYFLQEPLFTLLYIMVFLPAKFVAFFQGNKLQGNWSQVLSTK